MPMGQQPQGGKTRKSNLAGETLSLPDKKRISNFRTGESISYSRKENQQGLGEHCIIQEGCAITSIKVGTRRALVSKAPTHITPHSGEKTKSLSRGGQMARRG